MELAETIMAMRYYARLDQRRKSHAKDITVPEWRALDLFESM